MASKLSSMCRFMLFETGSSSAPTMSQSIKTGAIGMWAGRNFSATSFRSRQKVLVFRSDTFSVATGGFLLS